MPASFEAERVNAMDLAEVAAGLGQFDLLLPGATVSGDERRFILAFEHEQVANHFPQATFHGEGVVALLASTPPQRIARGDDLGLEQCLGGLAFLHSGPVAGVDGLSLSDGKTAPLFIDLH